MAVVTKLVSPERIVYHVDGLDAIDLSTSSPVAQFAFSVVRFSIYLMLRS